MEHQSEHQIVGQPWFFSRKERPNAPYGLAFPNLWAWLMRADLAAMCALDQKHQEWLLATAFRRAKVEKKRNVLRYSALTYRCALDGHNGVASELAGHKQANEIWDSYKGVATNRDAQAYSKILPT